jgi:hypothetical protein
LRALLITKLPTNAAAAAGTDGNSICSRKRCKSCQYTAATTATSDNSAATTAAADN